MERDKFEINLSKWRKIKGYFRSPISGPETWKSKRAEPLLEQCTVFSSDINSSVCKTVVNRAYNLKIQLPQQMALFTAFRNFT